MLVTPEEKSRFREQGYLVWERFFTPAETAGLQALANAALERPEEGPLARSSDLTDEEGMLVFSDVVESARDAYGFCCLGRLPALATELMEDDLRLTCDQLLIKPPGSGYEVYWHQDDAYTEAEPGQSLTCWVALSEATPDNGCLWFLPGTHRDGLQEHRAVGDRWLGYDGGEAGVPGVLEPGGLAVFSSLVLHRTLGNRSAGPRIGLVVEYTKKSAANRNTGDPLPHPTIIRRDEVSP
jgi:ectoine hydroxylase-related dioxygenase (phytanoyl-CoA dioxygenase family)